MDELLQKQNEMIRRLESYQPILLAYSGGVDSAYLAYTLHQAFGENILAVTVRTAFSSRGELERALNFAKMYNIPHRLQNLSVLNVSEVAANDRERCYYCKRAIFSLLSSIARDEGYAVVIDGGNYDDREQYRPGRRALKELGIVSPMIEAELTKEEIRELSRRQGLPTWNIPSQACLATRFPYGTPLTRQRIKEVDEAEDEIRQLGFDQVRLRDHGDLARIELGTGDFYQVQSVRNELVERLKRFGYRYVCLDLEGYRFGSMDK